MNHYRLYKNLNVQPFLQEIILNNDWVAAPMPEYGKLYTNNTLKDAGRIELIEAFRNPDDPERKTSIGTTSAGTWTGVAPSKVFHKYKIASSFLNWFKETHDAKIARVRYVKIPSNGFVGLHADSDPYNQMHNKFHFVVQGEYQYTVNEEYKEYKEGDLWWFDNNKPHKLYNHGSKDRISMIFDCKCDMESIINHEPL